MIAIVAVSSDVLTMFNDMFDSSAQICATKLRPRNKIKVATLFFKIEVVRLISASICIVRVQNDTPLMLLIFINNRVSLE